jgi:hypothetical protein
VIFFLRSFYEDRDKMQLTKAMLWVLSSPALLLIDHGHFQ